LVLDNVLIVQKKCPIILVFGARSSDLETTFDCLECKVTLHKEADGHHKVGRSHVDIILICEIGDLLDILQKVHTAGMVRRLVRVEIELWKVKKNSSKVGGDGGEIASCYRILYSLTSIAKS
jgi:hypothetical protein